MDLIVKTQEKQVTITVKGYLKAITSDDREIKFYISGENNIMNASDELCKHHIWHNPCPHCLGISFKLDFDPDYKAEVQFNL